MYVNFPKISPCLSRPNNKFGEATRQHRPRQLLQLNNHKRHTFSTATLVPQAPYHGFSLIHRSSGVDSCDHKRMPHTSFYAAKASPDNYQILTESASFLISSGVVSIWMFPISMLAEHVMC
ncbi:T-cell receptor beta chain V region C5 [Striga asiatica]|uniref:T-cell receptor beta chain V region C5 n=1 Tax=Striga asiatica TaxID=4170 RepID=A0A5A7RG13_STRAF|nr:T-cell receptor beta chain V region C5 [Striga asiatica]